MSKRIVILENIRSAYNVGNIIRTADSLWWEVWIVWYTPSPLDNPKVCKTSLGAENTVWLRQFDFTIDAINEAYKEQEIKIGQPLAVELEPLRNFYSAEEYHQDYLDKNPGGYCHIPSSMFKLEEERKKTEEKE